MKQNKLIGQNAERLAESYLKRKGIGIIARNYRCRQGEIDLIGWEGQILVFVEVKARINEGCGYPGEALTYYKRRRICHTASVFCLREHISQMTPVRFDVVEILGSRIRHIENAFEYCI
ncbi:MAG: YraN family protein [Lachnospiraceae bacterium]|nr:YraN family protein [Lachnospiraceae bacterium]